jgi:type VI protein secretion system component VasK
VNKAGADFCEDFGRVLGKSPVRPGGPAASIEEVTAFFGRPDGALWNLYKLQLSKFLASNGPGYGVTPGSTVRPTNQFVQFFTRAAQFSKALYPDGADQVPRLAFGFRANINSDVTQVKLTVNGTTKTWSAFRTGDQPFIWIGPEAQEVVLEVTIRGNPQERKKSGTWALWQLFADARNWKQTGIKQTAEWTFRHENLDVPVQFDLTLPEGSPILSPDWLRGMGCVSRIAQ